MSRTRELVDLGWLIQLRWLSIGGATALAVTQSLLPESEHTPLMLVLLGFGALSNLALQHPRAPRTSGLMGLALAADVVGLTILLALSGGASNPFTVLYLFQVCVAALLLPARWGWGLLVLAMSAYAGLFRLPGPEHTHIAGHLRAMWIALAVVGALLTFTITRVRRAMSHSQARMGEARRLEEQTSKLTALGTLAAGAAHELGTPLATIALVAKELERGAANARTAEDARLIRQEVDRCRDILWHMSADAGAGVGELTEDWTVREAVTAALVDFRPRPQVELDEVLAERTIHVPRRLLAQALRRLLRNAEQADEGGRVRLSVEHHRQGIAFVVTDEGIGMSPEVLARAGEPFFTTKGEGRGLGLFFVRSVAEAADGRLELESRPGHGTRVALVLP